MTATMTIEDTFTIKGRGLVLAGHPSAKPAAGMVARLPDGRAWTVRGVERFLGRGWRVGDGAGLLIGDAGDAPPRIGDVVELVGESPAVSTEPEGPRVVAGVTVYLDGKRLAENAEVTITEGVNVDALADLFERGTVKPLTWDNDGSTPIGDLDAVRRLMDQPPSPPVYVVSPAQAENLRRIEAWLRGGELEPTS